MSAASLLRRDLRAAHFSAAALTGLWGIEGDAALARGHRVPALRAIEGNDGALATLARLFVLGLPVASAALAGALPSLSLAGAREAGLVEGDEVLRPLLELRPHPFADEHGMGEFLIASDLGELALGHAIPESHVLGVGGASITLGGLMLGEPVERVLDLGTGCGIQALHAARHARRVVATDISPRALELAALNAELNEVTTIEFRLGSLYEPVAGERFDQIVSNPPFVITPRGDDIPAYEYRDGGMVGDALVAAVVSGAAEHLAPGGVAQLLGNWEYAAGSSPEAAWERVGGWADAAGLDVWLVEREVQSVQRYAETWIRDGGTRPGPEFDRLTTAWLDDFAARGVQQVGFGYLTLRRPVSGTPSLRRLERLDGPLGGGALGTAVAGTLRAHDWLSVRDDAGLANAHLTRAGDVTEERHYWPGEEHPTVMTLRQGGGFARSVPLDTVLAAVVGACDGELSIRALTSAIAQLLDADEAEVLAQVLPSIRELVLTGVLLPA